MEQNNKHPLNARKIALFVLYAIIAICIFVTILSFNDLPSILEQVRSMDTFYLSLAILMVILHLALFPISLCVLTKARKVNIKLSTTYTIAMTEHFFNGITPLATGGQPFQAHCFSKAKVKLSESTGLVMTNLLMFMIATNGLSLISLLFFDTLIQFIDKDWLPIILIGYTLNFLLVGITLVVALSKTVRGWVVKFVHFLTKFKLFSKLSSKEAELTAYFEQVQESIHYIVHKKWHCLLALISKFASYICLYGSSYFILLAMDVPVLPQHFPLIMLGTSFAITAVGFIPTPGASGGVEGLAAQVYKSIIIFVTGGLFLENVAVAANGVMLVFRLLSYYVIMIISLAFYIGLEIYFKSKKKKGLL